MKQHNRTFAESALVLEEMQSASVGNTFAQPLSVASHLLRFYMPTAAHVAPEVQFAAKLQVADVLAWHASHTSTFQG